MKIIYLIALTFFAGNLFSQHDWTKNDRNNLYEDFANELAQYRETTNDQRESIGLCCLEAITNKYSKSDFGSKIPIETKRIVSSTIDQCAKNIGLNLGDNPKSANVVAAVADVDANTSIITRPLLYGTWKTDQDMTITFNEDGTFLKTFNSNSFVASRITRIENSTVKGDWFLDGKGELTLVEKWTEVEEKMLKTNKRDFSETGKYNFMSFSNSFIKLNLTSGKYCCQMSGGKPLQIMQANKMN